MTVRRVGGEMVLWSDAEPVDGSVLRPLLAALTGRVLVAGPHAPDLLDAVSADRTTILVRGLVDAEKIAARYATRPDVTVCCGGLDALSGFGEFDAVVALDGLGRLSSAETTDLSWAEALALLLAVLRPEGRLLLGLANTLGVDRLVEVPPAARDADWGAPDERDRTRPSGPAELRSILERAGWQTRAEYAAYPAALLGAEVLADPELAGFLEATVLGAAGPDRDVLTDPGRLAVRALRRGLAGELAPGWFVLAGGDGTPPAALIASGSRVDEVRRDATGRWTRQDGDPVPLGPPWRIGCSTSAYAGICRSCATC